MGVIYWVYPNLILANSPVGVEIIDMLPAGAPTRCTVRHSWMGRIPATDDEMRSAYDAVFEESTPRSATRTSPCSPNAARASGTASTTT